MRRVRGFVGRALLLAALISSCFASLQAVPAVADDVAARKPLPSDVEAAIILKEIPVEAPVYIRVFKEESELEVWKGRSNGRYALVKTFPICTWSGGLGPKQTQGDQMAPEGFYSAGPGSLKPDSKYHLAFNVGYPNALDRALGRTGAFIMVHGDCKSVGCFAMSDKLIEEIYAFVRDAISAGQPSVPVHIFPFRMTKQNMARHADNTARSTWGPLKEAFDDFGRTREPPKIGMCSKRYVVNPVVPVGLTPEADCPALMGKRIAPMSPRMAMKLGAGDPSLAADGQKMKNAQQASSWGNLFGGSLFSSSTSAPAPSTAKTARGPGDRQADADMGALQPLLKP